MNSMNIRPAGINDKQEIFGLVCLLEETDIPADDFDKIYSANLNNNNVFYFVSTSDNRITGFISLHIQNLLHHWGKVAEIQELCVEPEFRSKGTGKILLEKAITTAKENNCVLIELAASQRREKAHAFYLKNGFKNSHFKFTLDLK